MKINLPYRVRAVLYIVTAVVTPIVAVLVEQTILPAWVGVLWASEVTVVGAIAAFNTAPARGEDE